MPAPMRGHAAVGVPVGAPATAPPPAPSAEALNGRAPQILREMEGCARGILSELSGTFGPGTAGAPIDGIAPQPTDRAPSSGDDTVGGMVKGARRLPADRAHRRAAAGGGDAPDGRRPCGDRLRGVAVGGRPARWARRRR